MAKMLTVVIAYYKDLTNLRLILAGLNRQSVQNFDVIIAEDDNNTETQSFLEKVKNNYVYRLTHIFQKEDVGFRKNAILNKAIEMAGGTFVAFIDGDCIPHKHFVKAYLKHASVGKIMYGRRVMLGQKLSNQLHASKDLRYLNFWSILISKSKMKEEALFFTYLNIHFKEKNLLGCNWCVSKADLLAVNGFDEDYVSPGVGEDVDIEWRLKEHGCTMFSMRNKAIVYHVFHPRGYGEDGVLKNYQLMDTKQKSNLVFCLNGIRKCDKNAILNSLN